MKIFKNKDLKNLTSFKIGGKASWFIEVDSLQDLFELIKRKIKNYPIFILGGGTNILIDDFKGIVLKPNFNFIYKLEDGLLKVGSGVLVKNILEYSIDNGYQGLEWAGGLPGTVGGAIEGGVGAFGGEFKNLVLEVDAFNLRTGEYKVFKKEECEFEYRNSFFRKNPEWLIISATLKFEKTEDKELLRKIVQEKINYRKEKHPLEYPNAGSVFKNYPFNKANKKLQDLVLERNKLKNDPFPVIPIAFLISEAGLAGKRIGDAEISKKHTNFIINLGRATFDDVLNLIEYVERTLEDKFNIQVEREIRVIHKNLLT